MAEPPIEELITRIRTAKTIPEIARATVLLLRTCGVYGYQAVGHEMARLSVTAEREGIVRK